MGKVYDDGVLAPQNSYNAFECVSDGCRNCHQYSQFMVGYFICRNIGAEFNMKKANIWIKNQNVMVFVQGEL